MIAQKILSQVISLQKELFLYMPEDHRCHSFSFDAFIASGSLMSCEEGKILLGWGERKWITNPQSAAQLLFYFPDFFLKNSLLWFEHAHFTELNIDDFLQLIPKTNKTLDKKIEWQCTDKQQFNASFNDLQKKINNNDLFKAVPYVFERSCHLMEPEILINSLYNLIQYSQSQPLYLYGFWDQKSGILGATPELLFRFAKKNTAILETVACAGTCNKNERSNEFLSDAKELLEHQLVVEGITESLASYGKVSIGNLKVLELPTLFHLMTPIEVDLETQVEFDTIVRSLHPTPALGAFPKKEGIAWLENYQTQIPRNRYGAPVGYLREGSNEAQCFVGIRNVQWNETGLAIGAGCGVVKTSQLDKEWNEVRLKIRTIKEMLAL